MNVWEIMILQCLVLINAEGEATIQQIYKKLEEFPQLTEDDFKKSKWGDYPKYQDQVRAHIKNLCGSKDLVWKSRTCYAITRKGHRRIGRKGEKVIEL